MKQIISRFYSEPVFALAVLSAGLTVLVAENVISGWVALVGLAVVTAAQRQLVTPEYE